MARKKSSAEKVHRNVNVVAIRVQRCKRNNIERYVASDAHYNILYLERP